MQFYYEASMQLDRLSSELDEGVFSDAAKAVKGFVKKGLVLADSTLLEVETGLITKT